MNKYPIHVPSFLAYTTGEVESNFKCLLSIVDIVQVLICFLLSDNDTLALRGNTIATKAIEAYMKLVGQKVA